MIGNQIIHLDRVDSTSNYIATLLSAGKASNGMVILAEKQTNGRGQRGTTWQSDSSKNILLSFFITHNSLEIINQEVITHFVSLAIANCLEKFEIHAVIKWPNDILVGNRKIAGILIENQLRGSKIQSSIIGIGMNVLQTSFEFEGSTSICLENQKNILKNEVLDELIKQLNHFYHFIEQKSFIELKNVYLEKLWLYQTESIFESSGEKFTGKIIGTDTYGRLQIESNNEIKTFDLKEIKFTLRNES
jgi:BirA family biotin operon repressor/biotin-[acetyl-CoA-carboxylase] ligase